VIHLNVDRRWLNFLTATETQLESLSQACTPATFGMDNKDVMDLSYRKAGKLDTADFLARFDPERLGLSEFVRGQLLEGEQDKKGLRTELYKLNVYGQRVLLLVREVCCSHHRMIKERTLSSSRIKTPLAVWT
jgi:hypothetical protein